MNIEKTISEHAVSDILAPMLESQDRIVTEDVAPLFDQATGLDTPTASGTVTTTIEESRSVITAIIRKAWTATLTMLGGASVISYIAAAYTYLRNRLQGNETYGIPDRRSEISATSPLAANLALLNDMKISEPNAIDGISLANLLCSAAASDLEAISDNNAGWVGKRSLDTITSRFPSVKSISVNVTEFDRGVSVLTSGIVEQLSLPNLTKIVYNTFALLNIENLELPSLVSIEQRIFTGEEGGGNVFCGSSKIKTISLPALESMATGNYNHSFCANNTVLEEISMPKCTKVICWTDGHSFYNNPLLSKVKLGTLTEFSTSSTQQAFGSCPLLTDLRIGEGTAISLNFAYWSPTLDSSNLQQFLANFRDYIANRLTDNGSGKTLTLSQAVFSEIWDSQGQPQVKGDGLDDLRADIHRIIRTDKQWAVNKA